MTNLLEQAIAQIKQLPETEQELSDSSLKH